MTERVYSSGGYEEALSIIAGMSMLFSACWTYKKAAFHAGLRILSGGDACGWRCSWDYHFEI